MWLGAHADSALFVPVAEWAASLAERAQEEGLSAAMMKENTRLHDERTSLEEQLRSFTHTMVEVVLGANRRTSENVLPSVNSARRELRDEVRRAYLNRMLLLQAVNLEQADVEVGEALERILAEARKLEIPG